MKISIASDHAGYEVKESIKVYLKQLGHTVNDCGSFNAERSDYPDFAFKAAKLVANGDVDKGILVCGSGIGMCIAANRFKHVRAVVLRNLADASISREHNDANIACFGARFTELETIKKLIDIFLSTRFEGGRHENRIKKLDSLSC